MRPRASSYPGEIRARTLVKKVSVVDSTAGFWLFGVAERIQAVRVDFRFSAYRKPLVIVQYGPLLHPTNASRGRQRVETRAQLLRLACAFHSIGSWRK